MRLAVDSKVILVDLGAEVRARRKALGLSQAKLAQIAQVHANVIGRLERGTYNPTVTVLCSIAAALGTSLIGLLAQARPVPRARGKSFKTG